MCPQVLFCRMTVFRSNLRGRVSGGILGAACKECDAVGNGIAEHNSGDDGDPHWCHRVSCASHHARETLSNGHGDISEGENLHHAHAQIYQHGCFGKNAHQLAAE